MTKQILLICADRRRAVRTQVALLQRGCMVELAGTFRRGLAVIQHRPPTAIVIDEALPDLDRTQLAGVLREKPETATLPVVMLALGESADNPLYPRFDVALS